MKKIVCAVVALLLTLPAWAKLNAHEEARINAMLNALAQKKDLTFVRNGDAHNCEEAVSHLRLNWVTRAIVSTPPNSLSIKSRRRRPSPESPISLKFR